VCTYDAASSASSLQAAVVEDVKAAATATAGEVVHLCKTAGSLAAPAATTPVICMGRTHTCIFLLAVVLSIILLLLL
jgi:hypothetical protein